MAEGRSNGEVARKLWVTEQTVKFHLSNIYRKLGVANRTEAGRWAQLTGLLDGDPEPFPGRLTSRGSGSERLESHRRLASRPVVDFGPNPHDLAGCGGRMRDRLGAACLSVAAGLAILLAFATPRASADPPGDRSDSRSDAGGRLLPAGAAATFSVTATDTDSAYTISCDHNSGDVFPVGSTLVTCTATDTTDSTQGSASFTVTVVDTTGPSVSRPGNLTAEATGASAQTSHSPPLLPTSSTDRLAPLAPRPQVLPSVSGRPRSPARH